jgi:ZIP family zinc transporter
MMEVFVGSVLSALSTGAGALIILFINQSLTHRWMDMLLAFSAGIMMAAPTIGQGLLNCLRKMISKCARRP